jgi:excisionase family DNA binding protein
MKRLAPLPRAALRKSQAAIILGISVPTVERLIVEKKLRAFRPTPTSIRILQADLEAFIRENQTAPLKETYVVVPKTETLTS